MDNPSFKIKQKKFKMSIKTNYYRIIYVLTFLLLFTASVEAGGVDHYIVGYVWNATDGTNWPADGALVTMYIQTRSNEKLTDIVGPTGNSGNPNMYQINIGGLIGGFPIPWGIGETLIIEVEKGVYTANTSLVLTGAGAEVAPNMTLAVHPCDLNHDGIIFHDYNDLRIAYKCFLGFRNCNNPQNWTNIISEYNCFVGNYS
ncbi:hypothetical protein BEH94_10545 [Candidatus Altiarchaeales archaeon WOR_SM1_SCG]|nr:hypothetical protein BEH94_10545 [Candidatus Altiarchaeales archaeon WOR_SM1_SCG]